MGHGRFLCLPRFLLFDQALAGHFGGLGQAHDLQHGGADGQGIAQQVLAHDDDGHTGGRDIFLRTGINQAELTYVHEVVRVASPKPSTRFVAANPHDFHT